MTAPQFAPGFSHCDKVSAATAGSVEKLARTNAQPMKPSTAATTNKISKSEMSVLEMEL